MKQEGQGIVLLNTGAGKGKTTAALGLVFRAWGHGLATCVIQFMKAETGRWGEVKAARKLGIEWHQIGQGFTWNADQAQSIQKAKQGWKLAQEKILSGSYHLIVLDEFTYPLHYSWLDTEKVIRWLEGNKPDALHVVLTGRDAPGPLVAYADLVTEMNNIKHPYDRGRKAQKGIEF